MSAAGGALARSVLHSWEKGSGQRGGCRAAKRAQCSAANSRLSIRRSVGDHPPLLRRLPQPRAHAHRRRRHSPARHALALPALPSRRRHSVERRTQRRLQAHRRLRRQPHRTLQPESRPRGEDESRPRRTRPRRRDAPQTRRVVDGSARPTSHAESRLRRSKEHRAAAQGEVAHARRGMVQSVPRPLRPLRGWTGIKDSVSSRAKWREPKRPE